MQLKLLFLLILVYLAKNMLSFLYFLRKVIAVGNYIFEFNAKEILVSS